MTLPRWLQKVTGCYYYPDYTPTLRQLHDLSVQNLKETQKVSQQVADLVAQVEALKTAFTSQSDAFTKLAAGVDAVLATIDPADAGSIAKATQDLKDLVTSANSEADAINAEVAKLPAVPATPPASTQGATASSTPSSAS